ncbi:HNH endonuclease [Lysinibacillus sp. BW-2-10]|uniref:HNH endonuclease n=1 Tax=Lysinibacillus sp. BW-2-10 TaxID=2590030 RepID=UPI00117F4486|nr:HNH endonuclease [Lysinibacillus sp. BW-2-10]TSI10726.1 HNH endonuclease [Lysinibacillus sp. BW-2-10]
MAVFRKTLKGIGTVGGGVIGGTVKIAGKAVGTKWKGTGEWLEDVGESVQTASKIALDNAGQFIDGAVQSTYGVIKKDAESKRNGLDDLKDSTGRTFKGIGSTIKYTFNNAGSTYTGLKSGDKEQAIEGLKNLGKVVAVSTLAIGVVDLLDGVDAVEAEDLETRNDHLAGDVHPETGVPFVEKTINGQVGIYPVFESQFNVIIAEQLYFESDHVHFSVANDTLYEAIVENPNLASDLGLSQLDVQALANGQTPDGFTWHHNEEPGVIQLVDEETHQQTGHTGGREIWGGGSANR